MSGSTLRLIAVALVTAAATYMLGQCAAYEAYNQGFKDAVKQCAGSLK